jgi:hypothetical protein
MATATEQSAKPFTHVHWNGTAWVACTSTIPELHDHREPPARLKIATLNVLADCWPWVVQLSCPSEPRIAALLDELATVDAEIVGLNEVTPNALGRILTDKRIRTKFPYATHSPETLIKPHSCVIMSSVPLHRAFYYTPPNETADDDIPRDEAAEAPQDPEDGARWWQVGRRRRAAKAQKKGLFVKPRLPVVVDVGGGVLVCALHTIAFQQKESVALRGQQVLDVVVSLRRDARNHTDFVLVGDLNLHDPWEDGLVLESRTLDVWAETHPRGVREDDPTVSDDDPERGWTFDAKRNAMIPHYIPGDTRRMRLDRILVGEGIAYAPSGVCRMWADTAVDAPRDIFLSDHFGLVVELVRSVNPWMGDPGVKDSLRANATLTNVRKKIGVLRTGVAAIGHIGWAAMRAVGAV